MAASPLFATRHAALGLSVAAVVFAAGCSASGAHGASGARGAGPAASSGAASSGAATAAPLSAHRAIRLAAAHAGTVRSFAMTLRAATSGRLAGVVSGTVRARLHPLLVAANLHVSGAGQGVPASFSEIINSSDLYLRYPALTSHLGKRWLKIPVPSAGQTLTSPDLGQIMRQVQDNNPFRRIQMLLASTDARKVGTEVVDGVTTTEYAGTVSVSQGLRQIPASVRAPLATQLKDLSAIRFQIWLDAQHWPRRIVEHASGAAEQVVTTMNVTAVNQPVSVPLPPAGEVGTMPGLLVPSPPAGPVAGRSSPGA